MSLSHSKQEHWGEKEKHRKEKHKDRSWSKVRVQGQMQLTRANVRGPKVIRCVGRKCFSALRQSAMGRSHWRQAPVVLRLEPQESKPILSSNYLSIKKINFKKEQQQKASFPSSASPFLCLHILCKLRSCFR